MLNDQFRDAQTCPVLVIIYRSTDHSTLINILKQNEETKGVTYTAMKRLDAVQYLWNITTESIQKLKSAQLSFSYKMGCVYV
jgi:hypothetical protein